MKKKVLTVCIGGVCRSVGLKDILNGHYGCDAIAASAIWQSDETMRMLCRWADLIIPVEPMGLPQGPKEYEAKWNASPMWDKEFVDKRRVLDIGPDRFSGPRDPVLKEIFMEMLEVMAPIWFKKENK